MSNSVDDVVYNGIDDLVFGVLKYLVVLII